MPTQAERSAAARRRLLDAATQLIAEQGVAGTSVAAIGARAGMSRGAVNFHFVSKDALLTAVADEVAAEWEAQVFGVDPGTEVSLEATLEAFLALSLSDLTERPQRAKTLMTLTLESLGSAPLLHQHFAQLHRRVRAGVVEVVRELQGAGKIRDDVDAEAFALMIIGLFRGMAFQYLLDPEAVDLEQAFAATRGCVLDYLAP